jgi:phosphoribosylformylglycinamidine synthase
MIYTIEVHHQKKFRDRHGEHVRHDAQDLGIGTVPVVTFAQVYRVEGAISADQAQLAAARLLTDPVTETCTVTAVTTPAPRGAVKKLSARQIEVWLKPGVTDTVAESVGKALKDMGIMQDVRIKTGQRYVFQGPVTVKKLRQIAERLLANPMVQEYTLA